MTDLSREVRIAFYRAVIVDIVEKGGDYDDVRRELERITGNPVRVEYDDNGEPTFILRDDHLHDDSWAKKLGQPRAEGS